MKQRIRQLLDKANLAPSRKAPFLSRRYPFAGAQRMRARIGRTENLASGGYPGGG
jgi:hypothetical protein